MKVVFLTHEYPPFIFGGIGGFVENLATGLLKIGIDVVVVCGYPTTRPARGYSKTIDKGITIIRCPYPSIPPHHVVFQLANLKNINKILKEEVPDIIHGQSGSSFPALLSLKKYAPVLISFHASPLMERNWSIHSILRGGSFKDLQTYVIGYPSESFIYKKEFQHSDLSVAVSSTLKSDLLTEMGQKYSEKTRYIYNGVNLEKLDGEYSHAMKKVEEDEHTVLFAGRLFWRKGALNIIRIAHLLQKNNSKFKIIIHGTGPLFNKMQSDITSLGLHNVELKGFTTRADLMKSLALCKYVAIPSMYDACPMALIEGICLGKIPLLLDVPFASELSEAGEYGVLASNIGSLANKLMVLRDKIDINLFSQKIRVFARKKFDVNETTRKYFEAYKELCL